MLGEIFTAAERDGRTGEPAIRDGDGAIPRPAASPHQKLVVVTEHRDTLRYLQERITTLLGRQTSVVVIHGSVGREERLAAQEAFRHDPQVQVLLATDAAGEGINLQRAHPMVNYDLPWNPNRLEQRFGRIHRIGQTEVCHLWNLVADLTREGDVYRRLLEKLEQARQALDRTTPRVLFSIEHALQDAGVTRAGDRRVVSKRVLYVELDNDGVTRHLHYAPYLDYRPLADDEPAVDAFLERPECAWIDRDLEQAAQAYAVADVVPEHLAEVRAARLALIDKTEAGVKDRLTKEISYWDPATGKLRFIEVKGRRSDADTVTVTKNEILYSLNKPDDFILALVLFGSGDDDTPRVRYVRRPFQREPDFGAASVNYALKDLLASAEDPRQGGRQVPTGRPPERS